jgi:hypothetical protein
MDWSVVAAFDDADWFLYTTKRQHLSFAKYTIIRGPWWIVRSARDAFVPAAPAFFLASCDGAHDPPTRCAVNTSEHEFGENRDAGMLCRCP